MKRWTAFWNILLKDMRTYYLKPPNISWGLIFPLAWTGMFFIRSGSGIGTIPPSAPGCHGGVDFIRGHLHAGGDGDI